MSKVDNFRRVSLEIAETVDAWRIVPRLLVGSYAYLLYKVVEWYMELVPTMIEGCTSSLVDCINQAPTTQHAVLVSAVVGMLDMDNVDSIIREKIIMLIFFLLEKSFIFIYPLYFFRFFKNLRWVIHLDNIILSSI